MKVFVEFSRFVLFRVSVCWSSFVLVSVVCFSFACIVNYLCCVMCCELLVKLCFVFVWHCKLNKGIIELGFVEKFACVMWNFGWLWSNLLSFGFMSRMMLSDVVSARLLKIHWQAICPFGPSFYARGVKCLSRLVKRQTTQCGELGLAVPVPYIYIYISYIYIYIYI